MLLHSSTNSESVPICITDEDNSDEVKDCNTLGMPFIMTPLLPRVSRTCRHTSRWHPATLMNIRLSIKARLLYQEGTTRLWHRLFMYTKPEPSLWLGSGTPQRLKTGAIQLRIVESLYQ